MPLIIGKLDPDQGLINPRLAGAEVLFLGACRGIALFKRGPGDPHVCFMVIHEDDGHWFPPTDTAASWFWAPDLKHQLEAARRWIVEHTDPDPEGFGYRFRE